MASENTCPICGLQPIPMGKTQCPQCDADMTCFKVLASLPEEPVRESRRSRKQIILTGGVCIFLGIAILLSVIQLNKFERLESRILHQQESFKNSVIAINSKLGALTRKSKNSFLENAGSTPIVIKREGPEKNTALFVPKHQVGKLDYVDVFLKKEDFFAYIDHKKEILWTIAKIYFSNTELFVPAHKIENLDYMDTFLGKAAFFTYVVHKKDTLWTISEKYFGNGDYYPVLLETNFNIGIYDLQEGSPIKILKDIKLVKKIYKKITQKEGNILYLMYTVMEGDTQESINKKFYKAKMVKRVSNINPDAGFKPGDRIRILLD